jgi:serine/threonine protein kinase
MPSTICDEALLRQLPLPLARLYRQAHNAKTALDRHQAAYYLWEAGLKLLSSTTVVNYSELPEHDPKLADRLTNLARPALGHWWEFVRLLVPVLAEHGDTHFTVVRDLLLGRSRDDLPFAAGLDASLRLALDGSAGSRSTVRPGELFDRLLRYRNRELGHGAAGKRSGAHYEEMGRALLAGIAELFGRLDVLAGRRLLFFAGVRRQASGSWQLERFELIGESSRRLEDLELPQTAANQLPHPERLYLEEVSTGRLTALHPLVVFDAEPGEVLFLNARRARQRTEYLCYTSGRVLEREDLGTEQGSLLSRVLGVAVDSDKVAKWSARSVAEEQSAEGPEIASVRGRTLGEFELLSKLGQGGMGVVYRAWQPSLGRQVALKCLLRGGEKAEARFAREIRALGRVEHPNLVKVFTSGAEGDQWFYAMELLHGATLAAVCEKLQTQSPAPTHVDAKTWHESLSSACAETRKAEQPIQGAIEEQAAAEPVPDQQVPPLAQAGGDYIHRVVELIRQTALAADALHKAGVIHRDIKPGNILVNPDGTQAVLMDLGLAQLADETTGKLTQTRQFVGTLRYASPEQVLAVDRLDPRSDVYSLGATLWELLTLQPLYGAGEQMPTPELMKKIQFEDPDRVRKYNSGVPADLEAVVMKCLEKDSKRRHATARELADELGRWLDGKAVLSQPPNIRYRAGKFIGRHRKAISIVTGLVLLQLVLLAGFVLFGDHFGKNKDRVASTSVSDPVAPVLGDVSAGKGRALLVGCDNYERFKHGLRDLQGPGNDVQLMRKLLLEQFHFAEEDIVVLADGGGPERRPTRANIEREVGRMADSVQPRDRCLIYLSGAGARMPVDQGQDQAASERLTSVFMPVDAEVELGKEPQVIHGAITSRDYAAWARPIVDKGAILWTIYDACHGGFGSDLEWPPGAVFLYASEPAQETFEYRYPDLLGERESRIHGVFTYTLYQILKQDQNLSYLELVKRIQSQYLGQYTSQNSLRGRSTATPWLVGKDCGHVVLGPAPRERLSGLRLYEHARGDLRLNAGSLQGITQGMILGVKQAAPGKDDAVAGYIQVTQVKDDSAEVRPCAYAGAPAVKDLPAINHCEPVYIDYGDTRLPVGLANTSFDNVQLQPEELRKWADKLRPLVQDKVPLARWTANPQLADVLVQISADSEAVYLIANTAAVAERSKPRGLEFFADSEGPPIFFGPLPVERLATDLKDILTRIARAQILLQLADRLESDQIEGDAGLHVDLKLIRYRNDADQDGEPDWRDRAISLKSGEQVAFQVENHGSQAVDVTLLWIHADSSITPFVVLAGENALEKTYTTRRIKLEARSEFAGMEERMVLIAAPRKGAAADFSFLADPDLSRARAALKAGARERTLETPVGLLLQSALYAAGSVRGADVQSINEHAFRKVTWQMRPPKSSPR